MKEGQLRAPGPLQLSVKVTVSYALREAESVKDPRRLGLLVGLWPLGVRERVAESRQLRVRDPVYVLVRLGDPDRENTGDTDLVLVPVAVGDGLCVSDASGLRLLVWDCVRLGVGVEVRDTVGEGRVAVGVKVRVVENVPVVRLTVLGLTE